MTAKQTGVLQIRRPPEPLGFVGRAAVGLAAAGVLVLLAAWQITPRLDWARYRAGISAFAGQRLGRPVSLGGPIHLALFPTPELTASDVSLADRGDGISARIGALKLTVALGPLLRGRLVPLSLELDDPTLRAPWPLRNGATPQAPALAQDFAAHVDGGTLQIGAVTLQSIDADIHANPDSGAFSATGMAAVGGTPFRFSAFLGAQRADGSATISLNFEGLARVLGTKAAFTGTRGADGAITGAMQADGPDASRLLAGPALPWSARGDVSASSSQLLAPSLAVSLGESPGVASAGWHLMPPADIDASLKLETVKLGPWVARAGAARAPIPMHLYLSANAADWLGGTLRDARMRLFATPQATQVQSASAILPGGGRVQFAGTRAPASGGAGLAGALQMRLPNLPATLAWLRPALPSALSLWPTDAVHQAEIGGDLAIGPGGASLANLRARLDGQDLRGEIHGRAGEIPAIHVTLASDSLDAGALFPATVAGPTALAAATAGLDASLDLTASHATLAGVALTTVSLGASAGPSGLAVSHLSANLPGGHISGAGRLAPDGTLADAHLNLDADDAAKLPAAWRRLPGLWHGPLHFAIHAAGPAQKIAVQARCDLGDLRAELEGTGSAAPPLAASRLVGTATLRHPGAPRLLQDIGVADAASWLDQGSVAWVVHFNATPGRIDVPDFTLAAAALHVGGQASLDLSTGTPAFSAAIHAPHLTLPSFDVRAIGPLPAASLAGWQGSVSMVADDISIGLRPVAKQLSGQITVDGGVIAAEVNQAQAAGGLFSAQTVFDSTAPRLAARGTLRGASVDLLANLPPWAWSSGAVDVQGDLTATGDRPAAWLASLRGTGLAGLQGAALQGIDLPRLGTLLSARGPKLKTQMQAAMASGDTGPLSGSMAATIEAGVVRVTGENLAGPAGSVDLSATLDLAARTQDAVVRVRPALGAPPTLILHAAGAWQTPNTVLDVTQGLAWAGERKVFFFEKKKQKTFAHSPRYGAPKGSPHARRNG